MTKSVNDALTISWHRLRAVAAGAAVARGTLLAALGDVRALRTELDALERAAVDAARTRGVPWAAIAVGLGLASRQAAEQRRLRLDEPAVGRDPSAARRRAAQQRTGDRAAGPAIVALRVEMRKLWRTMEDAGDWDSRNPAARLARQTVAIAVTAEPGALVDLARHVADDLDASGLDAVVDIGRIRQLASGA
jgi:hypothetical protein